MSTIVCHNCKKPGHMKKDCYFLKNNDKDEDQEDKQA